MKTKATHAQTIARKARNAATGFDLMRNASASGAFPLWAVAQERAASAIDDSFELGLDLRDPMGPEAFDTDSGFFAPVLWG